MEPALRARLADMVRTIPPQANLANTSATFTMTRSLRLRRVSADFFLHRSGEYRLRFGAIFLALYMMLDRDRFAERCLQWCRAHTISGLSRILIHLNTIVGGYIRGRRSPAA